MSFSNNSKDYKSLYLKYSSSNSTSDKDYKSLYLKYKIKYLNLKESNMNIIKQKSESFVSNKMKYLIKRDKLNFKEVNKIIKGGVLQKEQQINFEEIYPAIIEFIISYNQKQKEFMSEPYDELFDEVNYAHIKGGASIKYHLNKLGINTDGITNDIDILFLIDDPKEGEDRVNSFYQDLKFRFPDINWNIINLNGLYTIQINGVNLIDITIYDPNFDINDETSMFGYALKRLGFNNIQDYFKTIAQSNDIQVISFTSIQFELFSTEKAIQVVQGHINKIPSWNNALEFFIQQKAQLEQEIPPNQNQIIEVDKIIAGYRKQLQPEYIEKLKNKLQRYQQKFTVLNSLLSN